MQKIGSLTNQVHQLLKKKMRMGESRHAAKQQGVDREGVYSNVSYNRYTGVCRRFAKWAKAEHSCRTLADARQFVNGYIEKYVNERKAASTIKQISCALGKLYGEPTTNFIPTPPRRRADIKKHRKGNPAFDEAKHKNLVEFCRATGLRRCELQRITPEHLQLDEKTGNYFLADVHGKGGRLRDSIMLPKSTVEYIQAIPSGKKIWPHIPNRAHIHYLRAQFASSMYKQLARPMPEIPKRERYHCRGNMRGTVLDKRAMLMVSRILGHNRISVIAGHYLWATQPV